MATSGGTGTAGVAGAPSPPAARPSAPAGRRASPPWGEPARPTRPARAPPGPRGAPATPPGGGPAPPPPPLPARFPGRSAVEPGPTRAGGGWRADRPPAAGDAGGLPPAQSRRHRRRPAGRPAD